MAELVDQGNRLFLSANSKKGAQRPEPLKIRRPLKTNEKPPEKRNATPADLAKIFGPMGRRHRSKRSSGAE